MTLAYQLRIELRDFKPAIYRDVLVVLLVFFGVQFQTIAPSILKTI
ncbi:plasmid pRiA4b ORF-3 family protein [Limnohabitans sp. 2KL-1]|jgi:hypothetical protein|nr:plasmid pRiA4b ORF-3 family protein [Limnohabitans sp. 2KL-1]